MRRTLRITAVAGAATTVLAVVAFLVGGSLVVGGIFAGGTPLSRALADALTAFAIVGGLVGIMTTLLAGSGWLVVRSNESRGRPKSSSLWAVVIVLRLVGGALLLAGIVLFVITLVNLGTTWGVPLPPAVLQRQEQLCWSGPLLGLAGLALVAFTAADSVSRKRK